MLVENQLHVSSLIKDKPLWQQKTSNKSIYTKQIKLQNGSSALMLRQAPSKPLRFLYMALLMSKKNSYNMNTLMTKINYIKNIKKNIEFKNLSLYQYYSENVKDLFEDIEDIYRFLIELHQKLQKMSYNQNSILKLINQFEMVDSLLVGCLRLVADDYKMTSALDWNHTLALGQIQFIMNKFFVDKGAITNSRNKYVIFWHLSEIEAKYLENKGVCICKQAECYQELADNQSMSSRQYIMIEKVYSLL